MKKMLITPLLFLSFILGLQAQSWQTNLEEAKALALEQDRHIILVFQGSDWCAPCIKLDREVWSTDEFQAYAKDNYIMVQADFPRKKKNRLSEAQQMHNNALAEKYNAQGIFPLVVVMNAAGEVLGTTGYHKTSPTDYIKELDAFSK